MEEQAPFVDHAAPILSGAPINDDDRADLWDVFHNSKDHNELAQKLQPMAAPDEVKRQLFEAKKASVPEPPPLDKAAEAIHRIAQIDSKELDLAEAHPNVLKAFSAAAITPTKEAGGDKPSAESKTSGKQAAGGKTTPSKALVQPPRADGSPHMPPIPEGHHRVLASDGGIHDIPAENIEKARALDPDLHVLNP